MPHICSPRGLLRRGSTPLPAAASALISHSSAGNPGIDHPMHIIMPFMLKDTELILRNEGYNILALALCIKFPEIPSLQNLTIFTLGDDSVFLKGGEYFTNNVRYHILPNRRLLMADLMHLSACTRLPTLLHGQSLVVTENEPFSVNRVGLKIPDVFTNIWMAVHEIVQPYRTPHMIITIRENQRLKDYKDAPTQRISLLKDIKTFVQDNPITGTKLMLPSIRPVKLRTLINQSLNWQHMTCKTPQANPHMRILFVDHTCGLSTGDLTTPLVNNHLMGSIQTGSSFHPNAMKDVRDHFAKYREYLFHVPLPFE